MVFCLWTVAESVAVDIGVQVLALLLRSSLGCIPKSGVTGDRAVSLLEESSRDCFHSSCHAFAFPPA